MQCKWHLEAILDLMPVAEMLLNDFIGGCVCVCVCVGGGGGGGGALESLFYTLFCLISNHSKICFARRVFICQKGIYLPKGYLFARRVFICEFSCENRKINCAVLSFMFLKLGRIMLILWDNSIRVLYSIHVAINFSSLSNVNMLGTFVLLQVLWAFSPFPLQS